MSTQLKTEFNKDQRAAINAQLSRVNSEIAKMAGLGTMSAAPGVNRPGGTPTDIEALLKQSPIRKLVMAAL